MRVKKTLLITLLIGLVPIAIPPELNGQQTRPDLDSLRSSIQLLLKKASKLRHNFEPTAVDSAFQFFDSACKLAESNFGPEDTLVASALYGKAACELWKYNCAKGYDKAQRALEIWEKSVGPRHPAIAYSLWAMGDYYVYWGKYAQAEAAYQRGIRLLEKNQEFDSHHLGLLKNNLGNLCFRQGRFSEAEMYLTGALDIWLAVHGQTGWWVGVALANLAGVYIYINELEKAEKYLYQAITIAEQSMGSDHWTTSFIYGSLGGYFMATENYSDALFYNNKALSVVEKIFGPDDSRISTPIMALAINEFALGNEARAVDLAERAVRLGGGKIQGIYDPDAAFLRSRLARMYYAIGRTDQSIETYNTVISDRRKFISEVFPYAPESHKLRYISSNPLVDHSFLSLAVKNQSKDVLSSALLMILTGKAVVIDVLSSEKEAAYCAENTDILLRARKYSAICTDISNLTLAKPNIGTLNDSLACLYKTKQELEAEISRLCLEFRRPDERVNFTVEDITRALPENGVLLEYVKYQPFNFRKVGRRGSWDTPHYLGIVLNAQGNIAFHDLGSAAEIDSLIEVTLESMSTAPQRIYRHGERAAETELAALTRRLYYLLFFMIEDNVAEIDQIYISPDGQLNLLPFEILVDSEGDYLIERYQISYLSSGRDLMKYKNGVTALHRNDALIIADPNFDRAQPSSFCLAPAFAQTTDDEPTTRGPSDLRNCLVSLFDPLPAARAEGEAIAKILAENTNLNVSVVHDDLATEQLLKNNYESPSILHLATHGYYCGKASYSSSTRLLDNPLLYSGLALAGANNTIMQDSTSSEQLSSEDGILTSLEVSGLNLIGTDLVVLSACQTGMGGVYNGEGVLGLRRAFQHAGAQSIIMSMWPVLDETAMTLMVDFYSKWVSGNPRSSALREAALSVLEDRRRASGCAHPLFWGGFILVGNPN